MMMANDAYYEGFTQNDLDFRMQKTGASMEEYKAFAKEQVLDFTDEQKKIIDEHMGRIEEVIAEKGYTIPEMEQIVFINTTMKEECDAMAYTHGTQSISMVMLWRRYRDGQCTGRRDRNKRSLSWYKQWISSVSINNLQMIKAPGKQRRELLIMVLLRCLINVYKTGHINE